MCVEYIDFYFHVSAVSCSTTSKTLNKQKFHGNQCLEKRINETTMNKNDDDAGIFCFRYSLNADKKKRRKFHPPPRCVVYANE